MTSVSLLTMAIGAALVYSAVACVQFIPLLRGDVEPGQHCTGSLIALIGAFFLLLLAKLGGGTKIIPIPGAPGGKGGPPEPEPTPPEPVPAPDPIAP